MTLGSGVPGSVARAGRVVGRGRSQPVLRSRERWFYLLIAPWLIGLVALQVIPLLGAAVLAFAEWQPPLSARWVGLENFAALVADPRFATAVGNTVVYGLATVVPGLAIGLGLALVLGGVRRGGTILRATVFMPVVVAGVATALMWGWVLNPRFGLIDGLLGSVRGPGSGLAARPRVGDAGDGPHRAVERRGQCRRLPRRARDRAARAGRCRVARWRRAVARFRYITWPALLPVTFYLAIVGLIGASQVFTPTYVLTRGGPDDATLTTALYIYQAAFASGRLGFASAAAMVVVVGVLILAALLFRFAGRRVPYLGAES